MIRIFALAFILGSWLCSTASAAPQTYEFDYVNSKIEVFYRFEGLRNPVLFPDFTGRLTLDFDQIENSDVQVRIATGTASGGVFFATQALRGSEMLDAANFPFAGFETTSARRAGKAIIVKGALTLKGITKPVKLSVRLFRDAGTTRFEQENLILKITGQIRRSDFGVTGFADLVEDMLHLSVTARISRVR